MNKNTNSSISNLKISIIIVNYRSEEPLYKCLKRLIASNNFGNNIEIIIVNNGVENSNLLKKISKFPNTRIINSEINLGFAAAVNLGISNTNNNLILLLNPDTLVEYKSIFELANCLKRSHAGIVGGTNKKFCHGRHNTFIRKPTIYTYLFDYTNLRKIIPKDYFHKKHYYLDKPFPVKAIETDAVSGSYMLIDKKVVDKIGYFDDKFFMYLEDVDYCIRAKKSGFKIVFCPKSSIKHIGGHSSKNKEKVNINAWLKSRSYFVAKHENYVKNLFIQPIFFLDAILIKILEKRKWGRGRL